MPLHERLTRCTSAGAHENQDNPAHNVKARVKKVTDENAVPGGSSRFYALGKKTVSIPGKKDAWKRRVFENMNNQAQPLENPDVKRLKKSEGVDKEKSTAATKSFLPRFTGRKQQSKTEDENKPRKGKSRLQMPDIPIPVPLPSPQIRSQSEVDLITSAIDSLMCEKEQPIGMDFLCSPVYALDVLGYLQEEESKYAIPPTFLGEDTDISPHMRSILIDWLIQVQAHLGLEQSTLHLTARMIDAFVVRQKVALPKFQLVGITCLLIAAKFEERFAPSIDKLVHLTDNTYRPNEVLDMELVVLKVLDYQVYMPLPVEFLPLFLKCRPEHDVLARNSERLGHLANYLLDLTLHDIHMVQWTASMVAASCLYLAARVIVQYGEPEEDDDNITITICGRVYGPGGDRFVQLVRLWGPLLQQYSGYMETDLMPCVQRCAKLLSRVERSKYQGARDLYQSNSRFGNISHWPGLHTPVVMELATMTLSTSRLAAINQTQEESMDYSLVSSGANRTLHEESVYKDVSENWMMQVLL